MPQFQIPKPAQVRVHSVQRLLTRSIALGVPALLLSALCIGGAEAAQADAGSTAPARTSAVQKKADQKKASEKKAPEKKTPEKKAAGKKGARTAADSERLAAVFAQISEGLKSGQIDASEAFDLVERSKQNWVAAKRQEASGDPTPPSRPPVVAAAGDTEKAAARKVAARKKAARQKAAREKAAREKTLAQEAGAKKQPKKAVPASARRAPAKASQPPVSASERLSELRKNFRAAQRGLEQKVTAGVLSRQAANAQLASLRDQVTIATGAVIASEAPTETVRYKDKERELNRSRARGLMTEREVRRDLRLLREEIAAQQEATLKQAEEAEARQARREKQAAERKAAAKKAAAKSGAAKKAARKKPAGKKPIK